MARFGRDSGYYNGSRPGDFKGTLDPLRRDLDRYSSLLQVTAPQCERSPEAIAKRFTRGLRKFREALLSLDTGIPKPVHQRLDGWYSRMWKLAVTDMITIAAVDEPTAKEFLRKTKPYRVFEDFIYGVLVRNECSLRPPVPRAVADQFNIALRIFCHLHPRDSADLVHFFECVRVDAAVAASNISEIVEAHYTKCRSLPIAVGHPPISILQATFPPNLGSIEVRNGPYR